MNTDLSDPGQLFLRAIADGDHSGEVIQVPLALPKVHAEATVRFSDHCSHAYIECVQLSATMPDSDLVRDWFDADSRSAHAYLPDEATRNLHEILLQAVDKSKSIIRVSMPVTQFWGRSPKLHYQFYRRGEVAWWVTYSTTGPTAIHDIPITHRNPDEVKKMVVDCVGSYVPPIHALVELYDVTGGSAHESRYSDWIRISTCLETGIKEWISRKRPEANPLIEQFQAPPPHKLWRDVVVSLGHYKSKVRTCIIMGSNVRDRLVHRWKIEPPSFQSVILYNFVARTALFELQLDLDPDNEYLRDHVSKLQQEFKFEEERGTVHEFTDELKLKYGI